jgi:small subunit ribosomal protein S17
MESTKKSMKSKISKPLDGTIKSIIDSRTAVVALEEKIKHSLYNKIIKRTKKVLAHISDDLIEKDADGNFVGLTIKEGTIVKLLPSKPISKMKKWIIKK